LLDMVVAAVLLVALAPLLAAVALALRLTGGPGSVFFVQQRLGRGGVPFALHKFRTLSRGPGATVAPRDDPRTTATARWLRRLHVDELPQLLDVLRGRMALVGPRPEVPANLEAVPADQLARVLAVRPGITGPTQLAFLAEDDVLADVPDPVSVYRRVLVPAKVRHDLEWLAHRSFLGDLRVLVASPFAVCSRRKRVRSRARLLELVRSADRRETR
jgi:lipopolysaccharide/colanic/teichoic acid biosynthesis glycosyltransferase